MRVAIPRQQTVDDAKLGKPAEILKETIAARIDKLLLIDPADINGPAGAGIGVDHVVVEAEQRLRAIKDLHIKRVLFQSAAAGDELDTGALQGLADALQGFGVRAGEAALQIVKAARENALLKGVCLARAPARMRESKGLRRLRGVGCAS
jgi:hypothetical protein